MDNPLSMSVFATRANFQGGCRHQDMVERLTSDFADTLWNYEPTPQKVARDGFPGFAGLPDKQLEKAMADGGLEL